ncbi:MAG: hypothetical protein WDW38_007382 [Sanguina aurantia]
MAVNTTAAVEAPLKVDVTPRYGGAFGDSCRCCKGKRRASAHLTDSHPLTLVSESLQAAVFSYPVDSEGKAIHVRPWVFTGPHHVAFHLAWISFFASFVATFAPAALITVIRDDLTGITKVDLGNAGVASITGAIFARVCMGTFCDLVGPRLAVASVLLITAPAVFCMSMVENFSGFAAERFFIGCSLCMFVVCQAWTGSMFNVNIVGTANALTAGWGNMGGGATQFIMPLVFLGISYHRPVFEAWRWSFFIPGALFIMVAIVALLVGQDSPQGDFRDLKKSGVMRSGKGAIWPLIRCGLTNYRAWVLALTYGYSFGVELTVDNMIVSYLFDQFGLSLTVAGALGSIFGLMNLFSRATGGIISDVMARYYGMRGRLWALYTMQTLSGVFCLAMAYVDHSLGATIAIMVIFSIFCQQSCGAHYGIVPFVSRRSYGVVTGMVGAGGNVGAAVTQALFFAGAAPWQLLLTPQDGLKWMGVMTLGITALLFTINFPMWGGMLSAPKPGATEEDYYLREWSAEEVSAGLHNPSMKFAMESKSQRGFKYRVPAGKSMDVSVSGPEVEE